MISTLHGIAPTTKDCTGSLCIRCCTDETCAVHEEQRSKARWKQAVIDGKTDIQAAARIKRGRKIPKGRFKEDQFRYMHDTVVLWDLKSALEPTPPHEGDSTMAASTAAAAIVGQSVLPSGAANGNADYNAALKIRDEILRRSRKNNDSRATSTTTQYKAARRNYRGTKHRFRRVMENLYQKSLVD